MKTLNKTLRSILSLNRGLNLSKKEKATQKNITILSLSLIGMCLPMLAINLYSSSMARVMAVLGFVSILVLCLIISMIGKPIIARGLLLAIGVVGFAVHGLLFGGGFELEYVLILCPTGALLLSENKTYHKVAFTLSIIAFISIKTMHLYHNGFFPAPRDSNTKVMVGIIVFVVSYLIIARFKKATQDAQEQAERALAEMKEANLALKISESRYKALFDNAFEGIIVVDLHGEKIISCNPTMMKFFNLNQNALIGRKITDFLGNYNMEKFLEKKSTLLTEGKLSTKITVFTPENQKIYADLSCVLLPPPDTNLAVVIFKDVTTQVIAKKKMEQANGELKNFAHAASHDLKEPLRMISSFGQLLQRSNSAMDDRNTEYLGYIVSASNRMTTLINDLLQYSTATQQKPIKQVVDMDDILQIVLSNIRFQMTENQAIIYSSSLPRVKGNTSQLVQVFQNIISNAIKFRRPEITPEIRINTIETAENHLISIRDNGIGISPAYHDQVFGVFKRLHSKTEYEGSGIGLATCKKIVEQNGGKIWVESEPGFGTSFHFTWPILKPTKASLSSRNHANTAVLV